MKFFALIGAAAAISTPQDVNQAVTEMLIKDHLHKEMLIQKRAELLAQITDIDASISNLADEAQTADSGATPAADSGATPAADSGATPATEAGAGQPAWLGWALGALGLSGAAGGVWWYLNKNKAQVEEEGGEIDSYNKFVDQEMN